MLGGTVVALVRWPAIGFLGAMFFLTLAPTSSIVPIASEVGAERRMYLPLAALVVLAVSLSWFGLERLRAQIGLRGRAHLSMSACAQPAPWLRRSASGRCSATANTPRRCRFGKASWRGGRTGGPDSPSRAN